MGWSSFWGINLSPAWMGFSGAGGGASGGGKEAGASVQPPDTAVSARRERSRLPEQGSIQGKIVAGGFGFVVALVAALLFISYFPISRRNPPPVAEGPPARLLADPRPQAQPEPVGPTAVDANPAPSEPKVEPPAPANVTPVAASPAPPEFDPWPAPRPEPQPEPAPAEPEPSPERPAAYRRWTDNTGKHEVEAAFVSMTMGRVKLRKADGGELTLPLETFSDEDQAWIERQNTSSSIMHDRLIPDGKILAGSVVDVADGDTITIADRGKTQHRVRLEGIDAPERGQAYWTPAKEALAGKILGKNVRVEWRRRDADGGIVGHVFLGVRWINKELVAEGWAWHRKQLTRQEELAEAEKKASEKLLGLWATPNAVPPWEFKSSGSADEPVAEPAGEPAKEDAPAGEYWLTTSSGVRHNSSCRYYKKSDGKPCGPDAGTPCKVCGG